MAIAIDFGITNGKQSDKDSLHFNINSIINHRYSQIIYLLNCLSLISCIPVNLYILKI